MNKMVSIIGSIVVATFLLSIPVLCTLSFALNWSGFLQLILVLGLLAEYVLLATEIFERSADE